MRNVKNVYILLSVALFIAGCKKEPKQVEQPVSTAKYESGHMKIPDNFFKASPVPGVAENNIPQNIVETDPDPNNGDEPVILGQQLNNPYTTANMQQARWQLYGDSTQLSATHLYVRFKPSNTDQLSLLLDNSNLELQDYPMDHEVVQEGDYYQDPSLGSEDIGWLYSVVTATYTPPAGIQYEILAQLYLPQPDNLLLESMAESIAAGATYALTVKDGYRYIVRTDQSSDTLVVADRLPTPCEMDPCAPGCPLSGDCGGGGGGGGGSYNPQIPRGNILVEDIRTCGGTTPILEVAVRQARVVCKRWFKIALTYTNDQGNFIVTKKFNNKVKIIVKTENNHAKVSKVRGMRFWQILFPVKRKIGVFDQGAMANVNFLFEKPNPTNNHDRDLAYWVAATSHNSVLEYREYATEFGVGQPPSKFNIIVTNWGFMQDAGAAPMWKQCPYTSSDITLLQAFINYFVVGPGLPGNGSVPLAHTLKNQLDVIIGYKVGNEDYDCRLTSAKLKEIAFHEIGHASHFQQAGCDFWQTYRTRISNELAFGDPSTRPYGNGTETNAGIVAVGEMWGNHIGYIFADRRYGNGGANGDFPGGFTARLQSTDWRNIPGGLNCNLNALENHNPNIPLTTDEHRWIPQGVCYDLIDPTGELSPVIDNVFGYSTGQCFNALQSDVRTIPTFRDRLLQQNGNNQQTQVNALFDEYNY